MPVVINGTTGINTPGVVNTAAETIATTLAVTGATSLAALTTSSTVTHNGGTANGVAFLNASKVLTTGSALTFDGTNIASAGLATFGSAVIGLSAANTDFRVVRTLGLPTFYAGVKQSGQGAYFLGNKSDTLVIDSDPTNETAGSNIAFNVDGSEKARFDSSGNLGIGTSSPSAKLDVNGNIFTGAVGSTQRNITLATTGGSVIIVSHSTVDGNGDLYASFNFNGTAIGSITQSGTTAVLYNVTSDYRLKTVIGPVANAGQRIDALQPVEYTWNASGERTRGFLAHQFAEVYAGSVSGTKDAVDAEGKPVYQAMQASTSEVIADLVAEIQSLRQRLAAAGI